MNKRERPASRLLRRQRPRQPNAAAALVLLAVCTASALEITGAAPSACSADRQLMAGAASCSSTCNSEGTAACIAYSTGSDACMVANASTVTAGCPLRQADDGCLYQCLPWVETTQRDAFTFYVTRSSSSNASDWSHGKLRQNDQFLDAIGAMAMPDRIKYFSIIGGSSLESSDRNGTAVVDVRVALSLAGANVTNVTLANLNMSAARNPSIRFSATPLTSLSILNSQLSALPIDVAALPTVSSLDLSYNALTSFPREYSLESLQHLKLTNNALKSFDATFPALQSLDLGGNELESIPANVFLWTNLTFLDVSRNPLVDPTFTPAQFAFLARLSSLSISPFQNEAKCDEVSKKLLKTAVVCVLDPPQEIHMNEQPPSAGTLSVTSIVLLAVAASIASALSASFWYFRRQRAAAKLGAFSDLTNKTATTSGLDSNRLAHFVTLDEDDDVTMMKLPSSVATPKTKAAMASSRSLWADEKLLACQLRFEDIEDIEQIGSGAFGVVWLVKYRETRLLASKRLVKGHMKRQRTQDFVAEIKLNAQLEHPSIVQFVGAAWTIESDLQALFEYMGNGDLREYLDATKNETLHIEWNAMKLQIAIDITEALVYVHSFTPALVHRDLKSRNILLDEEMKAKLSDFGASRFQSENATMTAGVGTGRWLAPEVLAGDKDYDEMCDIYSLGVVFSELDTHTLPYEELQQADVATLQAVLMGTARPRFRESCPQEIQELAARCLAAEPPERPKAMEIAFKLRTLAKSARFADVNPE